MPRRTVSQSRAQNAGTAYNGGRISRTPISDNFAKRAKAAASNALNKKPAMPATKQSAKSGCCG